MSPKRTVDNPIVTEREIEHSTETSQIPEIDEKVKELTNDPFSLPRDLSLLCSTQNSIERLATRREADLDDEQIRAMLASPRFLPGREASAERSQIYHSEREGLMSSEFSEKESNLLIFQWVMNRFSETLTQRKLQNLFLIEIEITWLLKRDLNL